MKTLWFTIDDGPVIDQSRRLDLLERHGIPAVWFCLGENLEKFRAQAVETLRRGHLLANHSWDHPAFSQLTLEESKRQIRVTDELLQSIHEEAGVPWSIKLFRFPYVDEGKFRTELAEYLTGMGYRPGIWQGLDQPWWLAEGRHLHPWTHATFDTQDWGRGQPEGSAEYRTTEQVVERLQHHLDLDRHELPVAHAWVPFETMTAMVEGLSSAGRRFLLPT